MSVNVSLIRVFGNGSTYALRFECAGKHLVRHEVSIVALNHGWPIFRECT